MPAGVQNPSNWRQNHTRVENPDKPGTDMWVTSQICVCGNCGKTAELTGVSYEAPPPPGKEDEKIRPVRLPSSPVSELRYPAGWCQIGIHPTVKEREQIIDLIDHEGYPAGLAFEAFDDYASLNLFQWACSYRCGAKLYMKMLRRAYRKDLIQRTAGGVWEWLKQLLRNLSPKPNPAS